MRVKTDMNIIGFGLTQGSLTDQKSNLIYYKKAFSLATIVVSNISSRLNHYFFYVYLVTDIVFKNVVRFFNL
jgi:hypothetical protein